MDGKVNRAKQTVTPFCMFTLCEASQVLLLCHPQGVKKWGGGGRWVGELVQGRNITKQTETPLLFTLSEVLHKFF